MNIKDTRDNRNVKDIELAVLEQKGINVLKGLTEIIIQTLWKCLNKKK